MEKIAQIIVNSMNLLGRKIDSLAMELRNKRQPDSKMNISIPENVAEAIGSAMKEGLKNLKIPTPTINIPEQKAPVVNVPAPIVNIPEVKAPIVNVPPAKITVSPTPVTFPDKMEVVGMKDLIKSVNRETAKSSIFEEVSSKNPIAVMVVDRKGKHIEDFASELTAPSMVSLKVGTTAISETNLLPVTTDGFAIPIFDQQIIDESLAPAVTVIQYKKAGILVATKTISVVGTLTTITLT